MPIKERSKEAVRWEETSRGIGYSEQTRLRRDHRIRAARGQRNRAESRGVHAQERPMPLIAVPEGFPQLVHGVEGIAIEQRPHALPQQALAPQFGPDGAE